MAVALTERLRGELRGVNRAVNLATQYRDDVELYGRAEHWAVADGAGDCEDYALAKLVALVGLGWRRADLRLATCWVETEAGPGTGEYHAVLTVDTSDGTLVLDNRRIDPARWQALPYRWDKRERAGERAWEYIGDRVG